ncbi:16S rRNA (cytidine(1402)-2'-O)-methyltransferase [Legionella sp. km772]|uniref:16S rRNA (cytidine(1402)-2'-O)-methyltransferase n=1 Tax=Legionella sp. km772 TaxID=2498111 RepID=UPI000F8E0ECC|nr:16S rRNA (cytidine(1402)-2'-O)-methyltransferase [Legionella sp. km772]RUR10424.1 16S rRNA (cytidine(1402)-2'-O)-methyltransferase [Legionella sp. km772]
MTEVGATGALYIVATPIGNQEDISRRALNTLAAVDLILAEDTRHSLPLLSALGIKNNLRAFHAHNESDKSTQIIDLLMKGQSIALISDAGTPLISDPGYPLVKLARQNNIPVIPIPGACALITALSAAGVPCDSFLFLGFLPAKQQARQNKLNELKNAPYTLVFYESTHRILECLNDLALCYGEECELVLAKELTKTFERFLSGTPREVKAWLTSEAAHSKGEFVVIVPPRLMNDTSDENVHILSVLLAELPLKQAVSLASKLTKANKNELYELALSLKNKP